jgi:hypothetical protein
VHRAKTGSFLFRLACLVAASVGLMAQAQPGVRNPSTGPVDDKGFISRIEFGGSANTLGQEFILNGSAGYQFNRHFALNFGAPLDITHTSATATAGSTTSSGVGDPFVQMLFKVPNSTVNYASAVTTTVPLGDSKKGLSTGRVGIDWNNRFDHSFSLVTPFVAAGLGNTIRDTRFFRRPFTSLGFNTHLEGGADIDVGHNFSIGGSAYGIMPSGQQKVFSKIVDKGAAGSGSQHGAFGSSHETVGGSDLTRDHGFSTWIDADPNKLWNLELAFSRSMGYDLNTVSFTVGLNLGQLAREGNRH